MFNVFHPNLNPPSDTKIKTKLVIKKNKYSYLIGITGSFGTGKTTVAKEFVKLGAKLIDVDSISRSIIDPGTASYKSIVKRFGKGILLKDGNIDREKLAGIIFSQPNKRRILEAITHPAIVAEVNNKINTYAKDHVVFIVIDAPLLYEAGLDKYMDMNVVVWAPLDEQVKRIQKRDKLSNAEIMARILSQMPITIKMKRADYRIHNAQGLDEIRKEIKIIWNGLTKNM